MDMTSILILFYFTSLRLFLKKITKTALVRTCAIGVLVLYLVTMCILIITMDFDIHPVQQILSFFILMFFIRSLRESWKRIFFVLFHSVTIIIIICAYIIFLSLVGYTLFANRMYDDQYGYFKDIPHTVFNVYVLFTTSNFPDILFPFWQINNISALYFIGFLLIGLYMLLNLLLAVFYNSYK